MKYSESIPQCQLHHGLATSDSVCPMFSSSSRLEASTDLSSSLPNLCETEFSPGACVVKGSSRCSLSEIERSGGSLSELTSQKSDADCPSCSSQRGSAPVQKEVPCGSNENNNRLSAVLENIPLLYLPNTKQLVAMQPLPPSGDIKSAVAEAGDGTLGVLPKPAPTNIVDVDLCSIESTETLENSVAVLSQDSDHSSQTLKNSELSLPSGGFLNQSDDFDEENVNELTRMNTVRCNTAVVRSDASSFSSISSASTGGALSSGELTDENGFVEIALGPRNSFERAASQTSSLDSGIMVDKATPPFSLPLGTGAKPKRKGLTDFLARGLFSRKSRDIPPPSESAPGWKLFGKVPPKTSPQKNPSEISEEYKTRQQNLSSSSLSSCSSQGPTRTPSSSSLLQERVKKSDVEVTSTTALILEQRPQGLPCKDPEEELKHKMEYEQMVEAAKRKEQREAKQRRKQMEQQWKREEEMAQSVKIWNEDILPNWEQMSTTRKARDLWWSGIPSSVRGKVWKIAIGNDLNLTSELYEICLGRAKDRIKLMREGCAGSDSDSISSFNETTPSREGSVDLIRLDVSRTFPQLCIFQKGGPLNLPLQGLLGSYACYRPDVGYVQGMSFIAAVLLLNMEVDDAFICFANLLNYPCQIAFFRLDESLMKSYFDTYEAFFLDNLPKLYNHFKKLTVTPDLYLIDWMFTLYAKSLPLDVASRVWDVFCRDGEEFLFRTALGILKLYEEILLDADFIHLVQFLTKLPESMPCNELFKCIQKIHMTIDNRKFNLVLASCRDSQQDA